jgi:hypothetical protein
MKKPGAKESWLDVPPVFYQYLLGRIIMLALFVGSVMLVFWSVNRLPPLNRELQVQSSMVSQLADQVERMQSNWNTQEADEVAKAVKATREALFASPEEYTKWQQEIQKQSAPLGLDASAQLLKAKPTSDNKFASTPAVIAIEVQPATETAVTNSPYKRLLEFGQSLARPNKRVDVTELTVSGNSNSVAQARIEVQLWSQVKGRK